MAEGLMDTSILGQRPQSRSVSAAANGGPCLLRVAQEVEQGQVMLKKTIRLFFRYNGLPKDIQRQRQPT